MDMTKYKKLFLTESHEKLESMNQLILNLEKNSSDTESIAEIFRAAHSMKGMAASMGYTEIKDVSHALEDLLEIFRNQKQVINENTIDLLFECRDYLDELVKNIEAGGETDEEKTTAIVQKIKTFSDSSHKTVQKSKTGKSDDDAEDDRVTRIMKDKVEEKSSCTYVTIFLSRDTKIPSARGFLVHKKMSQEFVLLSCNPNIDKIKRGEFDYKIEIVLEGNIKKESLQFILERINGIEKVDIGYAADGQVKKNKHQTAKETKNEWNNLVRQSNAAVSSSSTSTGKVRVSTEFLDDVIDEVGEILISSMQLQSTLNKVKAEVSVKTPISKLIKRIKELYENVLSVRMVPFDLILDKYHRVVRDLARQTKKSVKLTTEGTSILIDRAILEDLDTPLNHIIRNAIDHGIEFPEVRRDLKKAERAEILIRSRVQKGMVEIEISDNGKGLDAEQIRNKAVAKGLIPKGENLDENEIMMLICRPGFSTSAEITSISGRGVGMDAVKSMVESYDGELMIDSIVGEGTRFTLRLPVTVSMIKVLLFDIACQTYALPVSRIDRAIEVNAEQIQKQQGKDVFLHQEKLVPIYRFQDILKFENQKNAFSSNGTKNVILMDVSGKHFGLQVDEFRGQRDVVLKPLPETFQHLEFISGGTILENGKPTFIFDVNRLANLI